MVVGISANDFQRYLSGCLTQWSAGAAREIAEPLREDFLGSLLLTDISGFTRLTARLSESDRSEGAERVSRLLNDFMGDLVGVVERHGGTVLGFRGDSLLAGWLASSSSNLEQVAWRSCHCAERIRDEVRGPILEGEPLHLRFAVGVGEIALLHLLPRPDQRWLVIGGNCLSQVARCGQLVDTGEIVVSNEVWKLIQNRCRGRDGRERTVRLEWVETFPISNEISPLIGASVPGNLRAYLPLALRNRLLSPLSEWLADLRTITAMFVHIDRSNLDADLDQLNKLVGDIMSTVARAGGEVLDIAMQASGLETYVVFGVPGGKRSDNVRRAIVTALRLSDDLTGMGIRPSIGIATGECFCGSVGPPHRASYSVVGGAVNTAARLASVAAGRILADSASADDAGHHIAFEGPWFLSIPGIRGEIPAFVPVSAKHVPDILDPHKLVDRVAELEFLLEYSEEVRNGRSGVLIVKGDPGIGKSALLRAFAEQARDQGLRILTGGADDIERSTPYFAWRGIVRELLGLAGVRGEEAREAVNRFVADKPHLAPFAPLLGDVINLTLPDSPETQAMSGDGRARNLRRLLHDLVADALKERPGGVVLEDVHWLDEPSGLLLGSLVSRERPIPVFVSTRSSRTETDLARWANPRPLGLRRLELIPLGFEDTATLVGASLRGGVASGKFDELIYAQSGGNPFLVCEICRMLNQRGLLVSGDADTAGASNSASDATLLGTAKATVLSRTDSLPADRQVVLKLASAIGLTFTAGELSALDPIASAQVNVSECLSHLQSVNLIKADDNRPEGFAFSHAIVRQAVYDSMLAAQRRQAHSTIAMAMEASGEPDNAENLPVILSHWERAGNLRNSHKYLDRVAELRLRQFDNAAVVDLISRFFRTADEAAIEIERGRRAAACFMFGEANLNLGRAEAARHAYEEGLRLAGVPLPVSRASLALHLVLDLVEQVWRRLVHRNPNWILEREIAQLPSEPFLLAAKAHEDLTRIYYFTSEKLRLVHATLRATNLAERHRYVTPTTAVNYASLGTICGVVPLRRQAEHYSRLAAALAERIDHPGTHIRVHLLAGLYQTSIGGWREAKTHYVAGLERALTLGDMRRWCELAVGLETITGPWLLTPAFDGIGSWQILVERICEEGRTRGDIQVLGCGLLGGIRGLAALDRSDDRMLDEFAKLIAEQVAGLELVHCVEGASFLADAAFKRGDKAEATTWLEQAFRWTAELNPAMKSRTLPALVGLFAVAIDHCEGGFSQVRSVLAKLRHFARVYPIGRPAASLCEAILRARLGQTRRAKYAAQRAFDQAIRLQMPADAAAALEYLTGSVDSRLQQEFERMLAKAGAPWEEVLQEGKGAARFGAQAAISGFGSRDRK
jgi:class 3 adenylate cyclase